MSEEWEHFNGRQFGRKAREDVRVTLGKKGNIYLNGKAFEALGQPAGHGRNDGRRNHTAGNYKRISAAAFCQHFRIRPKATMLFQNVDIDNYGVMSLDLTNTITVTRGAR